MPRGTGVRSEGLNRYIRDLQRFGVSVEDLKGVFAPITNRVVAAAQSLTPTKTGALRQTVRGSAAKNKSIVRAGTKRVNYASFNEFGSVHNRAVGMLTTAVTNNERYAAQALDKGLQDLARKYNIN